MGKRRKRPSAANAASPPGGDVVGSNLASLLTTAVELHRQGNLQQAMLLYRTVLSVDPRHADALHLLGLIAHQSGDFSGACALIRQAIDVRPDVAEYHFNLGVSLQALQRHAEAAAAYTRALEIQPRYRAACENLGVALQDADQWEAAAAAYARALELDPSSVIAHQNLGTLLDHLGRTHEAEAHFSTVIEHHPAAAEAHLKRAWAQLKLGDLARGWREYEWRSHAPAFTDHNPVRVVPFPAWDGSSLAGKTILVDPEQGIGDEIMFASCYADLIRAAGRTLIECDPRLVALFERSFPTADVLPSNAPEDFAWTSALPSIDYRVGAGSLPRHFRTGLDRFPAAPAYLRPDSAKVARWRELLAGLAPGLNVGISWRGGRQTRGARARSLPLESWRPLFDCGVANVVNLQYGDHGPEIEAFHAHGDARLVTLEDVDPVRDVDGFVALLAALDLVISIDNSTVFMAGAIGAPAWVLLPASSEWRWLRDRDTSPWHPSLTLFRQPRADAAAWRTVIDGVTRRLVQLSQTGRPPRAIRAPMPPEPESDPSTGGGDTPFSNATRAATQSRAVLVNDTSHWYHFGCSCTSLALHDRLRRRFATVESVPIHRIVTPRVLPHSAEAFDDDETFARFVGAYEREWAILGRADAVYVNGEGSLHNLSAGAVGLLYLAYAASTRLGKPVHLINHSCYPEDTESLGDGPAVALYRRVYERLAFVAVREPVSARLVARMGIPAVQSFDCLPLFVRDHFPQRPPKDPKSIVVAGSVSWGGADASAALGDYIVRLHDAGFRPRVLIGANAYLAGDDRAFLDAVHAVAAGRYELVNATSEREWLATIASAQLLVSGRFHHTIAAAALGTPFIVTDSNTPKVKGLLEALQSDSFIGASTPDLAERLHAASIERLADPAAATVNPAVMETAAMLAERNFEPPQT